MPFTLLKLTVLALTPLLLSSGVEVSERVQQYKISGSTVQEVAAQLRARGPRDESGRRYHALTKWEISWVHRQRDEARQCRLTTVQTYLQVTTTLPSWSPGTSASASLTASWNRYFAALKRHEQGHKQIGVEAAQEIQRRLARIPAAPNCAALNTAMRRTGQEVLAEYEQRSKRYDRETKHGLTQGAVFP